MAYEQFFTATPIAKEVTYRGRTETVYFKQLTAGERMALKKGQKGEVREGASTFELDLGDIDSKNHQQLFYSNCDENGRRVFNSQAEVAKLPSDFFDVLFAACVSALAEAENPTT